MPRAEPGPCPGLAHPSFLSLLPRPPPLKQSRPTAPLAAGKCLPLTLSLQITCQKKIYHAIPKFTDLQENTAEQPRLAWGGEECGRLRLCLLLTQHPGDGRLWQANHDPVGDPIKLKGNMEGGVSAPSSLLGRLREASWSPAAFPPGPCVPAVFSPQRPSTVYCVQSRSTRTW